MLVALGATGGCLGRTGPREASETDERTRPSPGQERDDLRLDNEDDERYAVEVRVTRDGGPVLSRQLDLDPDARRAFADVFVNDPADPVQYRVMVSVGGSDFDHDLSYGPGSGFSYLRTTVEGGTVQFTEVVR